MDKTKIALQIITILVGILILVILIQGNIEKNKKIEQLSSQVHDINAYIVDLKVNWITIYTN